MFSSYKQLNFATRMMVLTLAVICATNIALGSSLVSANADNKLRPIYCVDTKRKIAAISFDAAWGSDKTLAILDVLDLYNVKATFFLVGFWIDKYPDLVVEISRRGHEIGTHSMTHPQMSKLSVEQMTKELAESKKMIEDLIGKKVTVFRPPFGDYNNNLIRVCNSLDLFPIQWDVDSLDWKGLSAKEIAVRSQKATCGSIVLFHNNSDNIVTALPAVIEGLLAKGLSLVPIGDLIYHDGYYIDSMGRQRTK